jgi:hypothetical protein
MEDSNPLILDIKVQCSFLVPNPTKVCAMADKLQKHEKGIKYLFFSKH